jgi:hypothetical protein
MGTTTAYLARAMRAKMLLLLEKRRRMDKTGRWNFEIWWSRNLLLEQ